MTKTFDGGVSPRRCAHPWDTMPRAPTFSSAVKIMRVTATGSDTSTEPKPT